MSISPTAVLGGLTLLGGFFLSHSTVSTEENDWTEPVILWLSIGMPTGSGKSALFKLLTRIVADARHELKMTEMSNASWTMDEASFEKMGAMMAENDGRLLGIYDELTTFLTQIFSKEKAFLTPMILPCFCNYIMDLDGREKQVRLYIL